MDQQISATTRKQGIDTTYQIIVIIYWSLLVFDDKTDTFATLQLSLLQKEHEQKKLKIVEQNRQSTVGKGSTWQLKAKKFLEPTGYKPFLILIGLFAFQQFSGIFILISYSVTFFTVMILYRIMEYILRLKVSGNWYYHQPIFGLNTNRRHTLFHGPNQHLHHEIV